MMTTGSGTVGSGGGVTVSVSGVVDSSFFAFLGFAEAFDLAGASEAFLSAGFFAGDLAAAGFFALVVSAASPDFFVESAAINN
ncbi:MAG: hypothetical protein LBD30_08280 [Verrucomicrobiales bacterium]|nr:hypothetical protein [Verrucomicrobiales bacterium]